MLTQWAVKYDDAFSNVKCPMPDLDLATAHDLIEGDAFIIRPVTHDDVEDFFRLTRTPNALSPVPFEVMTTRDAAWLTLMQYLAKASHHKALAVMDRRGKLQGVIYVTIDPRDRKAILSWLFHPILDQAGNALQLFISSVADLWSRRLDVLVMLGEATTAELLINLGFRKEATLKAYIFRNHEYHDVWLFTRLVA